MSALLHLAKSTKMVMGDKFVKRRMKNKLIAYRVATGRVSIVAGSDKTLETLVRL
jgi:hypothetical protein